MKRTLFLLVAVAIAVSVGFYVYQSNETDLISSTKRVLPAEDPRLVFDTPFRNVKPDVKYVGDKSCAECHSAIDETYHQHPMGMSAHWTADKPLEKEYLSPASKEFEEQQCSFKVDEKDGVMQHYFERKLSSGKKTISKSMDAVIAVGSGQQGRSYLSVEDGTLWQSPISWYQLADKWGVSPGFRMARGGRRAVVERCAVCHLGDVELVDGTENQYKPTLMKLQPNIGCERCHGPGELHVAERKLEDKQSLKPVKNEVATIDTSIVNPKHLDVELRLSICQQCHFSGKAEVEVRGRKLNEYRPGLPFHLFLAQFTINEDPRSPKRTAQQIEQMRISKCFSESNGKMDCTSCHDPHFNPAKQDRENYFRNSCLKCHSESSCKESLPVRKAQNDNCIYCHMPTSTNNVVAHTSQVDHSIPRRPGANSKGNLASQSVDKIPIIPVVTGEPQLDKDEQSRNLGIAMVEYLRGEGKTDVISWSRAKPGLVAAVKRDPLDAVALYSLSYLYQQTGDFQESFACAKKAVKIDPNYEAAQEQLVSIALKLDEHKLALATAKKLVEKHPRSMQHRVALAKALFQEGKFEEAKKLSTESIEMNPFDPMPYIALAISLFYLGDRDEAFAVHKIAVEMATNDPDSGLYAHLDTWFADSIAPVVKGEK